MKRLSLTACISLLAVFLIASCGDSDQKAPETDASQQPLSKADLGDYSHGIAVEDMRFLWKLGDGNIDIKLSAPTRGWVAVGFNPETGDNMKGANLIIGLVRAGKTEVVDHYGTMKDKHKEDDRVGGTNNVSNISGSEDGDKTEVEFTIPLNSGDAKDTPISLEDDTVVLLAYGKSDRIILKHKFRAIAKVNLTTGKYSVVTVK